MGRIISKALAARLAYQQRVGRSVSIQEVADAVKMTRAALSRLEHNKTEQISFDTLSKLCQFYGVKPGDLLDYEEWLTQLVAGSSASTTNWAEVEALASAN